MHCLLCILAATCLTWAETQQDSGGQTNTVERIAVLGASATAGYGVVYEFEVDGEPQKTGVSLTDVLQAANDEEDLVFLDLSSGLFFMRPISYAQAAANRAQQWDADLILGIDFLFWCVFGSDNGKGGALQSEEQRLEKLELGLAILSDIDIPMVIGDVPDMSDINSHLLSRAQRPRPETVAKANARIHEWAKERPNVEIAPLHDLIVQIQNRQPFTIGDQFWDLANNEDLEIICDDQLHPTLDGLIGLAQALNETSLQLELLEAQALPLNLERDEVYTRLRKRKTSPRSHTRRRSQLPSLLSSARRPCRSVSLFAISSARTMATLRCG